MTTVLYPGSFVDIAPSFVFDSVTYVDIDAQAARFFKDTRGINRIIAGRRTRITPGEWRFIHANYTDELDLLERDYDLLVSLHAGFVSEHCTRYVRPGGLLLVNPSHGDVAMASIDRRYRLEAVVNSRSGAYTISRNNLNSSLKPKRDVSIDTESVHRSGRGSGTPNHSSPTCSNSRTSDGAYCPITFVAAELDRLSERLRAAERHNR